ncbi:MAG: hypothetical protein JNK58_12790 [Phycisphaerae bacterium]|nr:hypothetical protein [Phycisphaerae bacterium]
MPATRSRTENWRQSLQDLYQKNGAIEITLPQHAGNANAEQGDNSSLIWRVRVMGLSESEIIIEQPMALGRPIRLQPDIQLVGLIAIGQNRWMFKTANLGETDISAAGGRSLRGYRLSMPDKVERCQRRNFYRISTVGLILPHVEVYPILDPATAIIAETSNRCHILDLIDSNSGLGPPSPTVNVMPEVGPMTQATLVNIGGGGAGLLFDHSEAARLNSTTMYWLRINLQPLVPAPLGVCARVKHTHIDSAQRAYAGMAFEFGHDPNHEKFVVDQLLRYVAQVQRDQLKRTVVE